MLERAGQLNRSLLLVARTDRLKLTKIVQSDCLYILRKAHSYHKIFMSVQWVALLPQFHNKGLQSSFFLPYFIGFFFTI